MLGTIDYGFPSMSSYVSFDGGESWDGPYAVPYLREDLTAGGDPVVGFSSDGEETYMTSISIGIDEFNLGPVETAAQVSSIAVGDLRRRRPHLAYAGLRGPQPGRHRPA